MTENVTSPPLRADSSGHATQFFSLTLWMAQIYWQYAIPACKHKYSAYALSDEEFEEKAERLRATNIDEGFRWVITVIMHLLQVQFPRSGPLTPRRSGRRLKMISVARVVAGAPACRGDVETYLKFLDADWEEGDDWLPATDLYHFYRSGDRGPLLVYLNEILEESIGELLWLSEQEHQPHNTFSIFCEDSTQEHHYLNKDYLDTNYPLISSLLRYLEGEGGRA